MCNDNPLCALNVCVWVHMRNNLPMFYVQMVDQ